MTWNFRIYLGKDLPCLRASWWCSHWCLEQPIRQTWVFPRLAIDFVCDHICFWSPFGFRFVIKVDQASFFCLIDVSVLLCFGLFHILCFSEDRGNLLHCLRALWAVLTSGCILDSTMAGPALVSNWSKGRIFWSGGSLKNSRHSWKLKNTVPGRDVIKVTLLDAVWWVCKDSPLLLVKNPGGRSAGWTWRGCVEFTRDWEMVTAYGLFGWNLCIKDQREDEWSLSSRLCMKIVVCYLDNGLPDRLMILIQLAQ